MGIRKKQRAEAFKAAKKQVAYAKLNNCPTSPRKMRLGKERRRKHRRREALYQGNKR